MSEIPIRALGFSQTEFKPFRPGRLCRGRERWITPWELDEGAEAPQLWRLCITGAAFVDDSAKDALRGLPAAEIDLTELISTLFPDGRLLVFTEDGHPADIPDDAGGIELYDGYRAGGQTTLPLVRWYKTIRVGAQVEELIPDLVKGRLRGFVVLNDKADIEEIWKRLFPLVGFSTLDSPPAHYNPAALPDLLELARAVAVFHRDKHGPALGIYSTEPVEIDDRLVTYCEGQDRLLVPFAIPPMLARWDRALHEMRATWERDHDTPFPVPQSEAPSHWESRRNRRRRDRKDDQPAPEEAAAALSEEDAGTAPDLEQLADDAVPPARPTIGDDLDALLLGEPMAPATEAPAVDAPASEAPAIEE